MHGNDINPAGYSHPPPLLGRSDVMLSCALRRDTTALHKTSVGSVAVPLPSVAALRGTPVGPSMAKG